MSVDVVKQEINLKRLLEATEQIASTFVEEFAIEAAAASTYSEKRSVPYKSPYVITLFKKYIDEASRMIYELATAREEWDRAVEKNKEESATSQGISPSVSPSIALSTRESGTSGAKKSKSGREPPPTEHLEEFRRKLSFLANLLNSPRWDLPQHEVSMLKVVRNQRIPYYQQQAELETVAKVQTHHANVLRSELALPPLAGTSHRYPTAHFGKGSPNSRFDSQSENDESMSQLEEPISPSKKRMISSVSQSNSPRISAPDMLDSVFLEGTSDSDQSTTTESSKWDSEGSFNQSDADTGFASSAFASPRSQSGGSTEKSFSRPIARQLFRDPNSSRSSVQFETEFGKRLARGAESDSGDLGRLLNADIKMQDELTDELVMYAAAMKESALNAGLKIRSDTKKLDKMAERMETNTLATQSATSTVKELLNTSTGSIWGNLTMMSMVVIAFIVVWIFIKIVPKP